MTASLVVVDVGHGSCSIVREDNAVAIIDAGPGSALLEFLDRSDIKEIELVLVSHSDEDHLGGLVGLLASDKFKIRHILINSDSEKETRSWQDFRELVGEKHEQGAVVLRIGVCSGEIQEWKPGRSKLEAVSPSAAMALGGPGSKTTKGQRVNQNTNSIAVRLLYESEPVAFLGADIDAVALAEIVHNKKDCRAPFLVFPHHGGRPGSEDPAKFAQDLMTVVEAGFVIFSNGRGKHDAPRPEIVTALLGAGKPRIGCTQLSKRCAVDIPKAAVHLSGHFSHGSSAGKCCTGTIEIDMESRRVVSPALDQHRQFVLSLTNAMCKGSLN